MILGASFDGVAANCKFVEKFSFPFKLLCDVDKTIGLAYGAAGPEDKTPKRISYLIGPDRRIVRAYAKVKPADHPAEVLAALAKR